MLESKEESQETAKSSGLVTVIVPGVDLVKEAMRGAPAWLKIVLVLGLAGNLLAAYFGLQFFKVGNTWYALLIGCAALLLLLLGVLLFGVASRIKTDEVAPAAWSRSIPHLPLRLEVMEQLRLLMVDIRYSAYQQLNAMNPSIRLEDRQIRADVFWGDCSRANQGHRAALHHTQ